MAQSGYLFWSGDSRLEIPDQGRSHVSMMRSENTICNLFAKGLIDRIECKIYQTRVYLDHGLTNAKTISGHTHDGWAIEHKGAVTRANCLFIEILRGHHHNCPVLACNSSFECLNRLVTADKALKVLLDYKPIRKLCIRIRLSRRIASCYACYGWNTE